MTERPTVADTARELRVVVLALVVLALGVWAVCALQPNRVTRIRKPNQSEPLLSEGRSLSVQAAKLGLPVELLAEHQLHHGPRGKGPHYAPAGVANSEPAVGRFLRFRRASWDRRCVLSG